MVAALFSHGAPNGRPSPAIAAQTARALTRTALRRSQPPNVVDQRILVKSLYAIPTWSRTAALVAEHAALQAALGCVPSVYACYRFTAKLRTYKALLDRCIDGVVAGVAA